jgi:hypothetical protein
MRCNVPPAPAGLVHVRSIDKFNLDPTDAQGAPPVSMALSDTKVSRDTFVQLFPFNASGLIALCHRFDARRIRSDKGDGT